MYIKKLGTYNFFLPIIEMHLNEWHFYWYYKCMNGMRISILKQ